MSRPSHRVAAVTLFANQGAHRMTSAGDLAAAYTAGHD
jgi:hypothetical protein